MEYDLIRLFDHPVCLFDYIAPAVVELDRGGAGRCVVSVEWKRAAGDAPAQADLTLRWDLDALRARNPLLDLQLRSWQGRNANLGQRTEKVAIVVAAGVMANLEPGTRFTYVAEVGSGHDYYLNDTAGEVIEIAGRAEGGLPGLFDEKRRQSDRDTDFRRRWVSVTIFRETARNRTEGLHR